MPGLFRLGEPSGRTVVLRRACSLVLLVATLALHAPGARAQAVLPKLIGNVAAGSQLVGCDQADQRITVAVTTHLDPACVYTLGFEVTASNVVLDCRGAVVESPIADGRGIHIRAQSDVPLSNVTVRNCIVRSFQNGIRITRQGFKDLPPGLEYEAPFSNIRVENTRVENTRASGIFVDGYVTGVTLRQLDVTGNGGVGIYLEAGSKDNIITRCDITGNGYGDVDPAGIPIQVGDVTFRYLSTGREGIAVDGSRDNRIVRNRIAGNSAGGIFLYKNCGEDVTNHPNGWWERRYGADGNYIARNDISDAPSGIWLGARMAENQFFMDCSDPAYVSSGLTRIYLDYAKANRVRRNTFTNVQYGVRVEDDDNRIERNRFTSSDSTFQAVLVGTQYRTDVLDRPVTGSWIARNRSDITGNTEPFSWIHEVLDTTFNGNRSNGVPVAVLAPGVQPPINPFLFAKSFWVE